MAIEVQIAIEAQSTVGYGEVGALLHVWLEGRQRDTAPGYGRFQGKWRGRNLAIQRQLPTTGQGSPGFVSNRFLQLVTYPPYRNRELLKSNFSRRLRLTVLPENPTVGERQARD